MSLIATSRWTASEFPANKSSRRTAARWPSPAVWSRLERTICSRHPAASVRARFSRTFLHVEHASVSESGTDPGEFSVSKRMTKPNRRNGM